MGAGNFEDLKLVQSAFLPTEPSFQPTYFLVSYCFPSIFITLYFTLLIDVFHVVLEDTWVYGLQVRLSSNFLFLRFILLVVILCMGGCTLVQVPQRPGEGHWIHWSKS